MSFGFSYHYTPFRRSMDRIRPVFSLFAQLYITAPCVSPTTTSHSLLAFCLSLKLNGCFKLNMLGKLFIFKTTGKRKNNVYDRKGYTVLILTLALLELSAEQGDTGTPLHTHTHSKAGKLRGGGEGGSKCLEKHSGREMPKILKLPSSHWPQSR